MTNTQMERLLNLAERFIKLLETRLPRQCESFNPHIPHSLVRCELDADHVSEHRNSKVGLQWW